MKNLTAIALLFGTQTIFAQSNVQKIDSFLTAMYADGNLNGNVLIAEKGEVIYKRSFGYANANTKQKLDENSVFELASVSKQFTAMAIAMLHERGKLNYDDAMSEYLPELSAYKNITIRHMLAHTSGIADYMEVMDTVFDKNKIATNDDIIATFAKYNPPMLFEPGTNWEYSNTAYALLGSIIERVSGMSYGDFLKENIFKPLHMDNTLVYKRRYAPEKIEDYAYGYVFSDSLNSFILPDSLDDMKMVIWLDGIVGDGTVNSTVIDLLKWDRALYTDQLVSAESMKEIFTSSEMNDHTLTEYGFGWFIEDNSVYGAVASHTGGWPGYTTLIDRHIQNDKTIIILLNHESERTYLPQTELRRLLYNIEPVKYMEISDAKKAALAGEYENSSGKIVQIGFDNGMLYRITDDGEEYELRAITETKFQMMQVSPDVFYDFTLQDGKGVKYVMTQPETKVERELIRVQK